MFTFCCRGHLYSTRQIGRVPELRAVMSFNILPPVRAMSIELLAPVTWDDEMIINVGVARLGGALFYFFG